MALQSDQKALVFLGAIAVLGAGVRMARAARPAAATQPALEHQVQAADSARRATIGRRRVKKSSAARADAATQVNPTPRARLDLDIATATQIDSLPGLSPALSKRIVTDRMTYGPFMSLSGLRRVKGVSAALAQRIDTLVTFSGTIRPPAAEDTVIASAKPRIKRGRRSP